MMDTKVADIDTGGGRAEKVGRGVIDSRDSTGITERGEKLRERLRSGVLETNPKARNGEEK